MHSRIDDAHCYLIQTPGAVKHFFAALFIVSDLIFRLRLKSNERATLRRRDTEKETED
jgi:hypothetical protein